MTDYDKCACDKNPATHPESFNVVISEFGQQDKVIKTETTATCKNCQNKFVKDNPENAQKWPKATIYDRGGRVVLCKCGKPAEGAVIGLKSYFAYCGECSNLACEKYDANFVYRVKGGP